MQYRQLIGVNTVGWTEGYYNDEYYCTIDGTILKLGRIPFQPGWYLFISGIPIFLGDLTKSRAKIEAIKAFDELFE